MKPILVSGAKSKGGHWLIALHEAYDHIAADEDQPLDHTVGGNDVVRVRQRGCGDVGEGGGHRQADLDDSCGDADDGDGLDEFPTGVEGAQAQLDDGAPTEIEPGQDKEGDELRDGGGQGGPSTPMPRPQSNMNTGSSTTFKRAPVMTAMEEIFTEDSARAAQFMLWAGRLARAATNIQKA